MSGSLFSQSWYRVAELKPQLRSHARIHRQIYRDEVWYVLQDDIGGKYSRLSPEAMVIVEIMDGEHSMQAIWERACELLGDDMPTQDELIQLLGQLYQFNLMRSDGMPDIVDLHRRFKKDKRTKLLQYVKSPMSLKLPLFDPERFLNKTAWVGRLLYHPISGIIWLSTILLACLSVGIYWEPLTENFTDQAFSTGNFLIIALIYPFVKLVHEFGHAYAIKRWDGEVHELGLMFLVFIPVPYVDASSSVVFRSKYQRMLVAGSGIMVEAFLASVALLLWVGAEPGLFRAVLFNIMLIGGVSTILFNGNPLLRFDAYYVLSDWLEIPNLGSRSNSYVGYWIRRYVMRIKDEFSPSNSRKESVWLFSYSIASFIYRMIVMVAIAVFVATNLFVVGVLLAIWSLYMALGAPLVKLLRYIWQDMLMVRYRTRVFSTIAAFLSLLVFGLAVPLPKFTMVQGVFWAPEDSQVTAGANCTVSRLVQSEGVIRRGEVIALCESEEVRTDALVTHLRLNELLTRHRIAVAKDPTEARILKDEIQRTEVELSIARENLESLEIKAPASGVLFLETPQDLVGSFVQRGVYLGYIQTDNTAVVRAVVSQDDVSDVRHDLLDVKARRAEQIGDELSGVVLREVPAASKGIPSLALSVKGGGDVVLDLSSRSELQAIDNWFQFDIAIPSETSPRIGEKVYVRFEHSPVSLGERVYLSVRRAFLRQFSV